MKQASEHNQEVVKLDGIDKQILNHLMTDARKPILEIARKNWYFWSSHTPTLKETRKRWTDRRF